MARNVELKVAVPSLEQIRQRAQDIADSGPFVLEQVDFFFPANSGRLKLRCEKQSGRETPAKAELIAYQRSDEAESRVSDYERCEITDPECLRRALSKSLGDGPIVRKSRELYLVKRARIHLDTVESLGTFVEIEVVMQEQDGEEQGHRELHQHLEALGLLEAEMIDVAYADLLFAKLESPS